MSEIIPYDLEYLRTTRILPDNAKLYTVEQVRVLIEEENEACAKLAEQLKNCSEIAHAIRRRPRGAF